ncbi:hypothetical protein M0R45_022796 [Rubus argutus]|uniref:Uncharacterized protein n=1 Tax=Rubus argutus TaxID=59490 RepID=A0AAW1XFQ0_RUBAR
MATTATASFSLAKIAGFPPSSPPRCSCSKILAVKEGRGGMAVKARFGSSKGGAGVLERPKFDQTQFDPSTQLQEGGDIGRLKDKREISCKGVAPSCSIYHPDGARDLFHKSRENGVAVVIVTVKEHAEFYSQMMIRGGLRSSIEPDSNSL